MSKIYLNENLKQLIKQSPLSLGQIADRLQINKTSLYNYCNGVHPQGLDALAKLSVFFGITLDQLIYRIEPVLKDPLQTNIEGKYEIIVKKISTEKNQNN